MSDEVPERRLLASDPIDPTIYRSLEIFDAIPPTNVRYGGVNRTSHPHRQNDANDPNATLMRRTNR
jgi:hypothetical protein